MAVAKDPALVLVCGDDEFAVKQRAKKIYQDWITVSEGLDHEIIEAGASNSGDALTAVSKLREALQTLPFFGSGKVVWFRDCNLLGDERAASTQAVTGALNDLADELKTFKWESVRLLISAGKVDKRKTFFKTIDKIGTVESFSAWSVDDKDWMERAEMTVLATFRERKKEIGTPALNELINRTGPNPRQLSNETEKLCLFVGSRVKVELADVEAICSRNKTARAFALGDALGDRNLAQLMRCLDEELWEMKFDSQKSEIGLLYGLISKVRVMLLLKEMVREGWIKADADYNRFKAQLERVPENAFPTDKKFNPAAMHPWMLHRALVQSKNYSRDELVRAMNLLLDCNRKLVSSGLDEAIVLQQMLVQIVTPQQAVAA